ncbi:lysine--tRNA ligase [Candidatus Pacearchaeota archaeon]|nr:lysine--tRNA ligase [Candidatus Pacearchaeota archaeon]
MGRQEEIIKERMKKLESLRAQGIDPYPNKFSVKDHACNLQESHKKLKKESKSKVKAIIAGRLMSFRDLGKIAFGTLRDSTGDIQIMLQAPDSDKKTFEFFKKYIDSGDFLGVSGTLFRTKRGELSVIVSSVSMLSKSILPLPEKFHGLQDEEERYRKRYLDLITSSEVSSVFQKRSIILKTMRNFMEKNNFLEVETPLLQTVYGGALAEPFKTHINAYNSDIFLSIAPELPLKKALVGGLGNVYEITKKFRNEGADRSHNPEHMTIEWYQPYADYNDGMALFGDLMKEISKALFGTYKFEYQGNKIDLSKWTVLPLDKAIKQYLKEDVSKITSDSDAKKIAEKHNIPTEGITKANIQDELMKLFREKLIQPTFLTDYPIESSPLAKPKASDPSKAEVFQPFVAGLELARAYSELNDPKLQEEHFEEQEGERKSGNTEAMPTDKDFITALEHGMPPACGVGVGIERVVMLFTNQTSIRDVILFPFMKPENSKKGGKSKK